MTDDNHPVQQIQQAFTSLMRWSQRGDVRRALIGSEAEALSTNDITLLRLIHHRGPVRVSDVASWQHVDKSTVTPQIRRLENRGLLARQGHPTDGRAVLLTATDLGRERLLDVDEAIAHLFDRAISGWPPRERDALAKLMRRFADELAGVPQHNSA